MLAPGEQPDSETAQWAFRKLNYLIDIWQAKEFYVYSYAFQLFTLVPGLSPHTIGPNPTPPAATPIPTFSTGIQPCPVRIESSALILNQAPGRVDIPMNIRDHAWWAAQQVKEIQTNVPTDLFYNQNSPLGELYFWPVPNQAREVRLQYWQTVSQFQAITDPIGGPGGPGTLIQAYRAALMLTLAESLLPGGAKEEHPTLAGMALHARAAVFSNNAQSPRMVTQDFGMPKARRQGARGDFNWMTGSYPGGRPE